MKEFKGQKGFSLVEALITLVIFALVIGGLAAYFMSKAKVVEESEMTTTAVAGAQNGLEALAALPLNELGDNWTFYPGWDNDITITSDCGISNCDWLVVPSDLQTSKAKGVTFTTTKPEGKIVLLRRWSVTTENEELGLKKITVVVLPETTSTKALATFSTIVGKSSN